MSRIQTPILCLYCGDPVKGVRKGEHVVPEAIGGTETLTNVCGQCNNDFSNLDRELCSHSVLSLVAARELHRQISQSWDVLEDDGNLFLEGQPLLNRSRDAVSFVTYPQLLFLPTGHQFRGDLEQLQQFGTEKTHTLFYRRLRKAFWENEKRLKPGIFFTKVNEFPDDIDPKGYPPRVFVRGTVEQACTNKTIELRYLNDHDKRFALYQLEKLNGTESLPKISTYWGSYKPRFRFSSDLLKTIEHSKRLPLICLSIAAQTLPSI